MMFSRILNFDFRTLSYKHIKYFIPIVIIGYGVYDTFFDTGGRFMEISRKLLSDSGQYLKDTILEGVNISYLIWGIVAVITVYVIIFTFYCLQKSIKAKGKVTFLSILIPHFLANIIDLIFTVMVLYAIGIVGYLITGEFITDGNFFENIEAQLVDFYDNKIPTIINMPYFLAIFFTIIFTDLPGYILHWLTHKSRFLWYVMHRSHHTAEIMHPMGTGPVFGLGFLLKIPRFLVTLAVSKFVYYEPLLLELLVFNLFKVLTEKFNHASPVYSFAFDNKIVRFLTAFYGNGVYHYMHHSAKEGEENINISGLCFNFWDKVFGTYVKPRKEKPAVGLTNQPDIILNPVTLYFSGFLTIWYELRNNSIHHWFKIIFGTVMYSPPQTKDYLIIAYNKPPVK